MIGNDILLDGFARVYESLHRMLPDLTEDELIKEPHPPMGWLAWRLTRIMDGNVANLAGGTQLWIGEGWAARFGMSPQPADFGRSLTHTREQARAFRASAELLLAYHDAVYEEMKKYIGGLTADDLARQLDEPQFQPLPTVAVRLMSVLENGLNNAGQIGYLKSFSPPRRLVPRRGEEMSVPFFPPDAKCSTIAHGTC